MPPRVVELRVGPELGVVTGNVLRDGTLRRHCTPLIDHADRFADVVGHADGLRSATFSGSIRR